MKKYIIICMSVVALCLTGCYNLDRIPYDKLSSTSFWKTEAQCKQGLMGIYAGMKGSDLYGRQFMVDVNSDVAAGYDQYEILQLGTATPRTGFMNAKWQNGYDVIQKANAAIQKIATNGEFDQAKKTMFIGEAKFLRALIYSQLLDFFGGVPIYDETTDIELDFNNLMKPRSTAQEVRAFIIKDLSDAYSSGLPVAWDAANYGRVTKGAVVALRGKLNLFNKNYTAAISDFNEILTAPYSYTLHPKYAELFNLTGHTSSEMIFSIINLGGIGTGYGLPLCFYAGTRSSFGSCWNNTIPSTGLGDMYEYADGKPFNWDEMFPGYTAIDNKVKESVWRAKFSDDGKTLIEAPAAMGKIKEMYTKRDPRMMATVIAPYTQYLGWYSNAPKMMDYYFAANTKGSVINLNESNGYMRNNKGGWETYFWRKFVPEANWGGAITDRAHTPVNFPIIRLADVYLMLAEAYNESGDQTNAVKYINMVRARAGVAAINSGPEYLKADSKEEVFQRIFHERAVELAGEGLRDSDLRRWKISDKILNKDELGITGKKLLTRKFNKDRDYNWPIPASEIEMNPSLTQNPGW